MVFTTSSECFEPEDGCMYMYGIICLHANGISSSVSGRVCSAEKHVENTVKIKTLI